MKNKKTVMRIFTVADWQKEQDYLRSMHQKGWKFMRVSGIGLYRFEKCDSEDVIYQLDYNSQFDYNSQYCKDREEYLQLFSDCGWEHLQDFRGYSYFRKPVSKMNGKEEEIFCDDGSRLEMIGRVFRGRILPLITIFLCIIIPQMIGQFLSDGKTLYIFRWIFAGLFLIYLAFLIKFWCSYRRVKKEMGKQ